MFEVLGVGWPIRNWPEAPETSFLQVLIPVLVLVVLAVAYILIVRRADERRRRRPARPEEPEVRKAA